MMSNVPEGFRMVPVNKPSLVWGGFWRGVATVVLLIGSGYVAGYYQAQTATKEAVAAIEARQRGDAGTAQVLATSNVPGMIRIAGLLVVVGVWVQFLSGPARRTVSSERSGA